MNYLVTTSFAIFCFIAHVSSLPTSTKTPMTTTTPSVKEICQRMVKSNISNSDNCGECVTNSACFYCYTNGQCLPYPVGHIFPSGSDCPPDMGAARWGTCLINFKILLISMGVLAGILFIIVPCCIYCCCCRGRTMSDKNRRRLAKEEEKWQREEESRKARHEEKREERKKRYDEIRQKYGLVKPGSTPSTNYQRFENEEIS